MKKCCGSCLKFLFQCSCCAKEHTNHDYKQETSIDLSDIKALKIFVFASQCKHDISELSYVKLKNTSSMGFCLKNHDLTRNYAGYAQISKRLANFGDCPDERFGLKIHVSVNKEQLSQAWDTIMPLIIEYGVFDFKVTINPFSATHQAGKEIVIYEMSSRNDLNWYELLNKMERSLNKQGIISGDIPKHRINSVFTDIPEPVIAGSKYFYYSNDSVKSIEELRAKLADSKFYNMELENPIRTVSLSAISSIPSC